MMQMNALLMSALSDNSIPNNLFANAIRKILIRLKAVLSTNSFVLKVAAIFIFVVIIFFGIQMLMSESVVNLVKASRLDFSLLQKS